ncbi:Alpha-ribazole phosphatase [compost metagenome]
MFAAELAGRLALPLSLEKDLQELHFGEWEGRSAAELMLSDERGLGLFWADPYGFTPPGGEPVSAFAARVLAAVTRLQRTYAGERILLVSHGGVMRLLLAQARGLPREQLLQVDVGHGSLFRLDVDGHGNLSERR